MLRLIGLTIAVLALAVLGAAAGCGGSTTAEKFVGDWQEQGTRPARLMIIQHAHGDVYDVTYRRFYPSHGEFDFADGKLVYSPVTPELQDVITYDAGSGTITITSGSSGRKFTLARGGP